MNNNFRSSSGRSFGNYVPNSYDRNYPSIPRSPPPPTLDNPWRSAEESLITGPLGLMGLTLQSPSNLEIRVLDNRPQASSSMQEHSRLSQEAQMDAIKKLRKEVYNPVPKRLFRRLCLYYRDKAADIGKESAKEQEEDGKRCAVCLEDFEPKEIVTLTPCNHMFHEECIVPWVKSHGQCPVCRFSICEPSARTTLNNSPDPDLLTGADLIAILRAMGAM